MRPHGDPGRNMSLGREEEMGLEHLIQVDLSYPSQEDSGTLGGPGYL